MDELKRIERRAFSHKNSQREKRVLGVSIRLFRPLVLKKAFYSKLVEKKSFQNENSRRKRKNEKRGRKSTDRKLHFSKQTEREKNNVFLQKRVIIKLVLSQTRSFEEEEEEERGQREASSFS